jgi:hypothetical protein
MGDSSRLQRALRSSPRVSAKADQAPQRGVSSLRMAALDLLSAAPLIVWLSRLRTAVMMIAAAIRCSRLPTFRAEAADRARAAYTPDTTWPINGHSPGSSRS